MGDVIPPFVRHGLNLTEDQRNQIGEIESNARARLEKILTPEQRDQFMELLERGPQGGPMPGGPDGPPDDERPRRSGERPRRPARP